MYKEAVGVLHKESTRGYRRVIAMNTESGRPAMATAGRTNPSDEFGHAAAGDESWRDNEMAALEVGCRALCCAILCSARDLLVAVCVHRC